MYCYLILLSARQHAPSKQLMRKCSSRKRLILKSLFPTGELFLHFILLVYQGTKSFYFNSKFMVIMIILVKITVIMLMIMQIIMMMIAHVSKKN